MPSPTEYSIEIDKTDMKKRLSMSGGSISPISDAGMDYYMIRCSDCAYRGVCPNYDLENRGCRQRKSIYDNNFAKIEFISDAPIATNRLRLITKYYVELLLHRGFGANVGPIEANLMKTVLDQLSKLEIDKKGELKENRPTVVVPWERDSEVVKMQEEIKSKRRLEFEIEELKMKLEVSEKKKKKPELDEVKQ